MTALSFIPLSTYSAYYLSNLELSLNLYTENTWVIFEK